MKLKGLTKLALSGVALAAVAATLGTSTYAWYVSNSKATVTGVTGSTSTNTGGNLLLNALQATTDGESDNDITASGNWTNTLTSSNITIKNSIALDPITKGATAGTWNDVKNQSQTNKYGYYMFGAWVADSTSGSTSVNVTVGVTNTSESITGQTCYTTTGAPTGSTVNNPFKVDAVYALKLDVKLYPLDSCKQNATVLNDTTARTSYSLDTAKQADFTTDYATKTGCVSDGNAHDYYKALSSDYVTSGKIDGGEETTGKFSDIPSTGIPLTFANNTKYVVLVRYWLDGADEQCFDSCVGQGFKLDLKLEVPSV